MVWGEWMRKEKSQVFSSWICQSFSHGMTRCQCSTWLDCLYDGERDPFRIGEWPMKADTGQPPVPFQPDPKDPHGPFPRNAQGRRPKIQTLLPILPGALTRAHGIWLSDLPTSCTWKIKTDQLKLCQTDFIIYTFCIWHLHFTVAFLVFAFLHLLFCICV